ncbi:MAG: IS110 family transposase [Deltaproteobacteria bacterium]|nr:IS110 family transposase [Deltaproteobacteria bacterium]
MSRYYLGLDWGDEGHAVWVVDEGGEKVVSMKVAQSFEGVGEFGCWLNEQVAAGIGIWGAIEKPEGRIVDFLLHHGVVVYPINPKSLDRARDRFRVSGAKSDDYDARVLAEFLRTDHKHLHALKPSSDQAQELKMLTGDYNRMVKEQTRLINQLRNTLKEYYPLFLKVFEDVTQDEALDFLQAYPSFEALEGLTQKRWQRFAQAHRIRRKRSAELWEGLQKPMLPMPAHVVRAKSRLVGVMVEQLRLVVKAVAEYKAEVERFFADCPVAKIARSLPGGKSGTIIPSIWAELGDTPGRWESFRHLQAQAGSVPFTRQSGKGKHVLFRFGCNKRLRYAVHWLAFLSLQRSQWANAYYKAQRDRGHSHRQALRALGAKWLKIIYVMWRDQVPYDET